MLKSKNHKKKIIVVTGPTATGKTKFAVQLAVQFNGEIISADSRQVYRGMDIGSGKDLKEYFVQNSPIRHHLIDIAAPDHEYNLKEFCCDAWNAIDDVISRERIPLVCGGSPLYLDALINQYDLPGGAPEPEQRRLRRDKSISELQGELSKISPKTYAKIDNLNNQGRLIRAIEICESQNPFDKSNVRDADFLLLGIYVPRSEVHRRIEARLDERLRTGMLEEVESLHRAGISWERLEFLGLEYRYMALHLQGKLSHTEMRVQLLYKIRQFAKRQDIWFRKMEREGKVIQWLEYDKSPIEEASRLINLFLAGKSLPEPKIAIKNINYGIKK